MTRAVTIITTLFVSCLGLGASCPVGPSAVVVADASAELIVTGLLGDEEVTVRVGDIERTAPADGGGELRFYFELAAGTQTGTLVVDGIARLCGAFTLNVEEGGARATTSLDVGALTLCEDIGGDGGVVIDIRLFVSIAEIIRVDPCLLVACETSTRVDTTQTLTVAIDAAPEQTADIAEADYIALRDLLLTEDADALFAGTDPDCAQPRDDAMVQTTLTRETMLNDEPVEQTVDVHGCGGFALTLTADLAALRSDLLGL